MPRSWAPAASVCRWLALGTVQTGMGVEAGFVIVLLAVILDRVMRVRRAGNL